MDEDFRPVDLEHAAWQQGFDASSTTGLSCKICGALVARQPDKTRRHREWHEKLDER